MDGCTKHESLTSVERELPKDCFLESSTDLSKCPESVPNDREHPCCRVPGAVFSMDFIHVM